MPNRQGPFVEPRPVPGADRSFSSITISVDPPAVAPPSADARTTALLRQARDHGVTTFDVADARFPARAERLIATAFPSQDPELAVIVGRSVESLARERTPRGDPMPAETLGAALEESLEQSRRRLAPADIAVVEWRPDSDGSSGDASASMEPLLAGSGLKGLQWAAYLSSPPTALPRSGRAPILFTGELSLLDREVVPLFDDANGATEVGLIVRNPFADGRLDGSRFAATGMLAGPRAGPVELRRFQTEFDSVLALGFLTKDRRRTLAQAALRFVLGFPWVVTSVIPLPTPERFEEILSFGASPPLSEDELAKLGLVK
jgi:aryl-alcohol dehydrogenase-like predicted oxidoreductase